LIERQKAEAWKMGCLTTPRFG